MNLVKQIHKNQPLSKRFRPLLVLKRQEHIKNNFTYFDKTRDAHALHDAKNTYFENVSNTHDTPNTHKPPLLFAQADYIRNECNYANRCEFACGDANDANWTAQLPQT